VFETAMQSNYTKVQNLKTCLNAIKLKLINTKPHMLAISFLIQIYLNIFSLKYKLTNQF